jgi:putative component of membrane protein insertase Oxa1/YidC/SpoIIIJ protein YidD
MSGMAVGAIGLYRRYLSPLKGFSCAHNAVHRRGSCSSFGLKVFERYRFGPAMTLLRRRLDDCRRAYALLMASASAGPGGQNKKSRKRDWFCDVCDPTGLAHCSPRSLSGVDLPDFAACDCLGGF